MPTYAIEMRNIAKGFGGVPVLKNVDFTLKPGEVKGLVGKNGAGKSTLVKILQGIHQHDAGTIKIFGHEIQPTTPIVEREEHISTIFQEFSLIPEMTVMQNIFLNHEPKKGLLIDDRLCFQKTKEFFERLEIGIDPREKVKNLSTGDMQMVEISKAVMRRKRVLLMDEPTAALEGAQTERLFHLVQRLKEDGISIVLITHHLKDIMEHADSVTILRDGEIALDAPVSQLTLDDVIGHMLGDVDYQESRRAWRQTSSAQPILELKGITSKGSPKPISFSVYPGEVLGIAGLKGSGRTELFHALLGIDPIRSGEIVVAGKPVTIKSPADALKAGIALVPENRQTQGLSVSHTLYFNAHLPWMHQIRGGLGTIDDRTGRKIVSEYVDRFQVKTPGITALMRNLSGGNQQKIVIAKNLATEPLVLLMDDPTYGVDIQAKAEIQKIIDQFVSADKAVILVSSELPDLLQTCDRILVLSDHAIVHEFRDVLKGELTEAQLAQAIQ